MNATEIEFFTRLWYGDLAEVNRLLLTHPELESSLRNPEYRGTYFERAAVTNDLEGLKLLINHGADIHAALDEFVNVGIVYPAVRAGSLKVVEWLLDQGAEVHDVCQDVRRCQPLLAAAQDGNLDMIKLLVEKGKADVNATWLGNNALKFAREKGSASVIDYLLAHGARMPDDEDRSPPTPNSESLVAYLADQFGQLEPNSIVEIAPTRQPITIHVIRDVAEEHQILVTEGASARPIFPSDDPHQELSVELAIRLPLDWPLNAQALEAPERFWPIGWLRQIALHPDLPQLLQRTYAVVANEEPPQPLGPNTAQSCLLLLKSDHRFGVWQRPDGGQVHFFELLPLYAEERDLEIAQGLPELFERFESYMIGQVVEPDRINVGIV